MNFFPDEAERRRLFPVAASKTFFAHAAVTALPATVADAMCGHIRASSEQPQEFDAVLREIKDTRRLCAELIDAKPEEIALLGPTSLGLSLFANGLPWNEGDEVVCYADDYPANVYPWIELRRRGVVARYLEVERPGEITPEIVAAALTERTKLVALASCHFFSGYRIDVDAIGQLLHARGILFSVDAIQTIGAFPISMKHVDFLSADAHKWMLGPVAAGIVYVKQEHFERCRPTLLGAWNVYAPNFISQDEVRFVPTAQRYEPGVLNSPGIYGMKAGVELFLHHGMDRIAGRLLELKARLVRGLQGMGCEFVGPITGPNASGITTFLHPHAAATDLFPKLQQAGIVASLRYDRQRQSYLRLSPHFYNTEAEVDFVLDVLGTAVRSASV